MSLIQKDQTTKSLNMRMKLPDTRVAIQCMEEEFVESKSSGNFHIHRTWEVINQPPVTIDGQEIDLLGTELNSYTTTKWSDGKGGFLAPSDAKVRKGLGRAFEDYEKLGITIPQEGFDTDQPPLEAKGKVVDAVLSSEEQPLRNPPTPEQIAKGQKVGDIKQDENGKNINIFRPKISYILGVSNVEAKPF